MTTKDMVLIEPIAAEDTPKQRVEKRIRQLSTRQADIIAGGIWDAHDYQVRIDECWKIVELLELKTISPISPPVFTLNDEPVEGVTAKLGKKGIAAFVNRKRAAQKKAGDAKKGGERSKGQRTTKVKTGA